MQYRLKNIGIHILAFLVARCSMPVSEIDMQMYPFVVPFFMAAYLKDFSGISLYLVLLLGVMSNFAGQEILRYGLILLFLLFLLDKTDRNRIFAGDFQIALAAGMVMFSVSMPFEYVVTGRVMSLAYTFLEGVIAGTMTLIFEQGFEALRVGTGRMFADNKRFIGLFAMMAAGLFGCPNIQSPVLLIYVLAGYLLLYNAYRFDSGVGIATGSLCGVVLAFWKGEVSYLVVMLTIASLIVLLKEAGKPGVLLAFVGGNLLLGTLYEKTLLDTDMLAGCVVTTVLFLLTPKSILRRVAISEEPIVKSSQDILVQEATKRQIDEFGQAFIAMEKMLSACEKDWKDHVPTGLSNMYLSGDGISLLNAVESENGRLNEMRKNFIRQLKQVGEIIKGFQGEILFEEYPADNFEARLSTLMIRRGVEVTKAVCLKDKDKRIHIYIRCRVIKNRLVSGKMLARTVSKIARRNMKCVDRADDLVGSAESIFYFVEEGRFYLTTGIMRKNRQGERLCGDNFSISKNYNEKACLMISDGMGSGENANEKSRQIMDLIEQLLSAGFGKKLAVEMLNSFISFVTDGSGSGSLDITALDLYTGNADFIKLGASTTFIKHEDKVECIRSNTLPVGVFEEIEFDTCTRKIYHGDVIVMISDGVLDGITADDREDYLATFIAENDTDNMQKLAGDIMNRVLEMQDSKLRDDSTVMTIGVWER